MLTDEQITTLEEIANIIIKVDIQAEGGRRAQVDTTICEAVINLYKLGAIRYLSSETHLVKQFTVCCNLVADAINGYQVMADFDQLAIKAGLFDPNCEGCNGTRETNNGDDYIPYCRECGH